MGMLKKSIIALLGLASSFMTHAQPEPHWDDGYRVFQDQAPNFVRIEVLNINVDNNRALWFASASDRVEIEARVLQVIRSEDDLQPGMLIPILYNRKAVAGGTFSTTPSLPEVGSVVPAFIRKNDDHFIPAARHHTFSPLTDQQIRKLKGIPEGLSEEAIAALRRPETIERVQGIDSRYQLPLKTPPTIAPPRLVQTASEGASIPDESPETDTTSSPLNETPEKPVGETMPSGPTLEPAQTEETMVASDLPAASPSRPSVRRRNVVVIPPSELRTPAATPAQPVLREPNPRPLSQESTFASPPAGVPATPSTSPLDAPARPVIVAAVQESPPTRSDPPTFTPDISSRTETNTAPQQPVLREEPVIETRPETGNALASGESVAETEPSTAPGDSSEMVPPEIRTTPAPSETEPLTVADTRPSEPTSLPSPSPERPVISAPPLPEEDPNIQNVPFESMIVRRTEPSRTADLPAFEGVRVIDNAVPVDSASPVGTGQPVPSPQLIFESVSPMPPTRQLNPLQPTTAQSPSSSSESSVPVTESQTEPRSSSQEPVEPEPTSQVETSRALPGPAPEPEASPPAEEIIRITDYTPPPAPSPPATGPVSLTEVDQKNMKTYADIYSILRQADDARNTGDKNKAISLYRQALSSLQTLKEENPEFQPFMVEYRLRDTGRKLESLIMNSDPSTSGSQE